MLWLSFTLKVFLLNWGGIAVMKAIPGNERYYTTVRSWTLVILSAAFLHIFFEIPRIQLVILTLVLAGLYVTTRLIKRFHATGTFLTVLFAAFVIHKYFQHSGLQKEFYVALGLSFLFLKVFSYSWLFLKGHIKQATLGGFLAYCLFFPAYLSGPIYEYEEFHSQLARKYTPNETAFNILKGTKRIILGWFKVSVLERFISNYTFFNVGENMLLDMPRWAAVLSIYITLFDLYLNFSGAIDMALGASKCLGLDLPENFAYPFTARNMVDFWQKWHITFSNWLRKYIFLPLSKFLFSIKHLPVDDDWVAAFSLGATFSMMGIWHGLKPTDLAYGAFHGIGVFAALAWGQWLKKKGYLERYMKNPFIHFAAWAITMNYVSFGLILFYADNPEKFHLFMKVLRRLI